MTNPSDAVNAVVENTDGLTMRLQCTELGLTKREYFAAIAIQGLVNEDINPNYYSVRAKEAVQIADALIKALNE